MTRENGGTVTDLLAAYISVWNQRNPQSRQAIGAQVFNPDAYYVDPNTSAQGRLAIDTYVAGGLGLHEETRLSASTAMSSAALSS